MPEANNYTFTHTELTDLLIKAADLHEGEWQLTFNFSFAATNLGQDESSVVPAGVMTVNQVGLTRATSTSPKSLVRNASVVNPPA